MFLANRKRERERERERETKSEGEILDRLATHFAGLLLRVKKKELNERRKRKLHASLAGKCLLLCCDLKFKKI